MMPQTEGRYRAMILDKSVHETGQNNLATWVAKYQLFSIWDGQDWQPVDPPPEITGYHYIEKKDGTLNDVQIGQIKAATGWDGRDPVWLDEFDHSAVQVQVTIKAEEYNGQTKLKVAWLDGADSDPNGGGIKKDPAVVKSIASRLGSKLRAAAGGSPVKPPAAKPAASKPLSMPKPKSPPVEKKLDKDGAWDWFVEQCREGKFGKVVPDNDIANQFSHVVGALYETDDPDAVKDWSKFKDEAGANIIPF